MGKVVLAYSGGLDTTVAIHWLKHRRNFKVSALTVNLGHDRDIDVVGERALSAGAETVHVVDVRRTFLKHYCWKALKAGAKYEDAYLLSCALSRPLIATELVKTAHNQGANVVAHSAPPLGNDQFRLERCITALDPMLSILSPIREWNMKSREDVLKYARLHNLDIDERGRDPYTRDENIWGTRASGGDLADVSKEPADDVWIWTQDPLTAPNEPELVTISYLKGEPVRLNDEKLEPVELMQALNQIGARHGVGRVDLIEDRLLGFKNREVYESPGATLLHSAHDALERLVLDHDTLKLKRYMGTVYADQVYTGNWFSTIQESLAAFFKQTQEYVTGSVTLKLFKGSVSAIRGESEYSTYDREIATLKDEGTQLGRGQGDSMLAWARTQQLTRAFKQRPRL